MTLKELSQLYRLNREIEWLKATISRREARQSRKDGKNNQTDIDLDYYRATLNNRLEQCNIELVRLNNYIADCPDSLTRQILSYRFIDGLSWDQVAAHIGGITSGAAKMIAYRFIGKK